MEQGLFSLSASGNLNLNIYSNFLEMFETFKNNNHLVSALNHRKCFNSQT